MKNSKRINNIIKHLEELKEVLDYYSHGKSKKFTVIQELQQLINDYGVDEKEHNVRLIQKWEKKHDKTHR